MEYVSTLLTFTGLIILMYSLRPTGEICDKSQQTGWRILYSFILFFILVYLISTIRFFTTTEFRLDYLIHAIILFSGSIFVLMVTHLSQRSLRQIEKSIAREKYNALHDNLTSLGNRRAFLKTMAGLIEEKSPFTLLIIDLNNFKQINNAMGHYYGDEFLRAVSDKLRTHLPKESTLHRLGGNEFALLWEDKHNFQLKSIVDEIHFQLSHPLNVQGYSLCSGAGIGVSSYPRYSSDANELLQQANLAMYASKHKKADFVVFSEELTQGIQERLTIAAKLKDAVQNKEFQLYYQPIIEGSDNSVHGAEVLIRWPQKDGSFIPPDQFISVAEQSSVIHDITCWVIQQCISELPVLKKAGFTGCLHINLSAKDMHNPSLLTILKGAIAKGILQPGQLFFEITESTMMTDISQARKMMNCLAQSGFSFSIDDFGTGFSSLSLLKLLPLAQIKIDQSFVTDMLQSELNQSIVNSIIYLAKSLQYSVVAEGIEDNNTARQLQSMGCHYLQGYYFSKPLPLTIFTRYIQDQVYSADVSSF